MRKGQKAPSYVKKKLSDACTEEKRKLISERKIWYRVERSINIMEYVIKSLHGYRTIYII